MGSILFLGLLLGVQHALEADHIAAISSIVAQRTSIRRIAGHGAAWGLGHALTLAAAVSIVIAFGLAIGDVLAAWLELAVGVMLIGLGGDVIRRLIRDRVHFHAHRHVDGVKHLHAHSHAGETGEHDPTRHRHEHAGRLPLRSLLVGMMHGMAGSGALLVLAASAFDSPATALLYCVLFGAGSIIGMTLFSAVIAVPLAWSARALTWANHLLQGAIGGVTVSVGITVIVTALDTLGT